MTGSCSPLVTGSFAKEKEGKHKRAATTISRFAGIGNREWLGEDMAGRVKRLRLFVTSYYEILMTY